MTEKDARPASFTLDMRGTRCPAPLLGAKTLVDEMRPGDVLVLLSDCPGTPDDLFAWAKVTGNHVARTERLPDGGHAYHVQRGRGARTGANAVLDLRGTTCPGPIVEAKKLLNGMQAGETLKLVSNCPGIRDDVADWVRATRLTLLGSEEIAAGEYEFYIRK